MATRNAASVSIDLFRLFTPLPPFKPLRKRDPNWSVERNSRSAPCSKWWPLAYSYRPGDKGHLTPQRHGLVFSSQNQDRFVERSERIFATRPPASRISSTFGGSAVNRMT